MSDWKAEPTLGKRKQSQLWVTESRANTGQQKAEPTLGKRNQSQLWVTESRANTGQQKAEPTLGKRKRSQLWVTESRANTGQQKAEPTLGNRKQSQLWVTENKANTGQQKAAVIQMWLKIGHNNIRCPNCKTNLTVVMVVSLSYKDNSGNCLHVSSYGRQRQTAVTAHL